MVSKKAVDYVAVELEKGYSIDQIKDIMKQVGYNAKDISEAIKKGKGQLEQKLESIEQEKLDKDSIEQKLAEKEKVEKPKPSKKEEPPKKAEKPVTVKPGKPLLQRIPNITTIIKKALLYIFLVIAIVLVIWLLVIAAKSLLKEKEVKPTGKILPSEAEIKALIDACALDQMPYHHITLSTGNESLCGQMDDAQERIECLATARKNADLCEKLDNRDHVIECKVEITQDTKYCHEFIILDRKYDCLAMIEHDPSYCYKLSSPEFKFGCLAEVTLNCSWCDKAGIDKELCKEECLGTLPDLDSFMVKSVNRCTKEIYHNLSLIYDEASFCEKVEDHSLKKNCRLKISMITRNVELCNTITDEDRKICIATISGNIQVCESIDQDQRHDKCIWEYIAHKNTPNQCSFIRDNKLKKECIDLFSQFRE